MPEEIITTRISVLSPQYRLFIESGFTEELANTFGSAYSFSDRKVEILENAITLYLLFFLSDVDTIDFISRNCELSPDEASSLFWGIIAAFPEGLYQMVQAQFLALQGEQKLASEIAETEKAFESLQGIRTMATDMREAQTHHVPTHQSSQSDLIRPTTPPPPPQNGPRWETDK